jgi:glucose dehydrogenase
MAKRAGISGVFTSILVGAVIWFVLQVIIGVLWWASVIAGGVVALVGILLAVGVFGARAASKRHGSHESMLGAH